MYVDAPSLKGIAVADLGIGLAKSAGNDWSKPWPADQLTRLISGIEQFARWAYRVHRLTGLWGVDVIWSPDGPAINEINCRLQGTTETASAVQRLRDHVPLVLAHLALQLGRSPTWLPTAETFNSRTIDWTATRRKAPFYVKLRATRSSTGTPRFPGSGVYHLGRHNELAWLRPGATPLDADFDQGEVLLANVAPPGTLCTPGAELATAEGVTSQPVFTPDSTGLSPAMTAMIITIRTAINRF